MESAIEQLAKLEKTMLTPSDVAPVIGCHPYSINIQAHKDPDLLGFPVIVVGRRVRIPREGFLNWYYGMRGE